MCRELDRALCAANPRWFPVEGEEATVVGSFIDLRADDAVAPHYRDPFAVYLMRGAEMWRLAGQVLGKAEGYNRGRSVPFNGPVELNVVPWVAGDLGTSVGTATGAALAFQHEGSDRVCVCTFGDGTANRGDVHEAINLAACWRLPIVYVCQNNGWAISQPLAGYVAGSVASRAQGYGIPGACVDGNDVDAVRRVVGEAVARARGGSGPSLVEARTWRWRGHWAGDDQAYRLAVAEPDDVEDPLDLYAHRLLSRGLAELSELQAIHAEVEAEVASAMGRAALAPDAGIEELGLDDVYAAGCALAAEPRTVPAEGGPLLTQTEAVVDAIAAEMRRDRRVFYIGQDVGAMGGSLQGTAGLLAEFGACRIREAPISESAMVGAAVGAALFGQRPIVEISFGEFLPAAMNQLINQAPNIHYMTGGAALAPLVVRTRVGDGPYGGHPQDYSAWFAHVPGWKVVMPARPCDARALMLSAIRDDDPVLFVEAMSLAHAPRGPVLAHDDEGEPIGQARVARAGSDATLVAVGSMVAASLGAAETLVGEGIDVEVIDLRSIQPLDVECVAASVRRTGRLVTVHEAWVRGGLGAEVVAAVVEACPAALRAPVVRVGTARVPTPSGKVRPHALPNARRVLDAVHRVMGRA